MVPDLPLNQPFPVASGPCRRTANIEGALVHSPSSPSPFEPHTASTMSNSSQMLQELRLSNVLGEEEDLNGPTFLEEGQYPFECIYYIYIFI